MGKWKQSSLLMVTVCLIMLMAVSLAGCGSSGAVTSGTTATAPAATGGGQQSTEPEVKRERMTIAFGSASSTSNNYVMVSAFANLWSRQYPNYIVSPELTTGGVQNVREIKAGNCQMGICAADVMYYAYNNSREFEGENIDNIRYVTAGSHWTYSGVTLDPSINSFEDVKGKRVAILNGTSLQTYWPILLEGYGYTEADFSKVIGLASQDLANALLDGTIDYALFTTTIPTPVISDIALSKKVKMIGISDQVREKLMKEHSYMMEYTIPAGTYGIEADVITLGGKNVVVADKDLPDQAVYDFLEVIMNSNEELKQAAPIAAEYNTENCLPFMNLIPMHPGAEKWYKDNGII